MRPINTVDTVRTRGEDDFGSTPDFKLIKYAPLGHTDSGQNAFICCFAYTGYFHSLRFRSPVCARRNIFLPSFPLFRSNGGEIDLTTGNRIYKSFPQRVILLRNETTERERERESRSKRDFVISMDIFVLLDFEFHSDI